MKKSFILFFGTIVLLIIGFQNESLLYAQPDQTVKGIVFHDRTGNGTYDPRGDKPLKGIAVSNGREVVLTDRKGIYELPLRENTVIFVIKPRNWKVPVDKNQMPGFYYMHSPQGVTGDNFNGLHPTGPLPDWVNFPLYRNREPRAYNVLVFGDTQPRNAREIYYMANDVTPELTGIDAEFGITMGDIVFDDLNLFDHLINTLATIGIPMCYIAGNHDIDYSGNNNKEARGAWYRTFGPSYYSFSYGPAHYVVLDNIRWIVEDKKRYYRTGLGEDQMEFLRNEISRLKSDQLLILLSHIPYERSTAWENESEKKAFYELIASHPNTISLAAHTHRHYHHFIDNELGFPGEKPHHLVSMGTVCGAWWTGAPDEYGIPHAMMSDGTPNSYGLLQIDGNSWKIKWKAAGKPADFQMHINAPEYVDSKKDSNIKVIANIFNALPSAKVRMRIGNDGEWVEMERNRQYDPFRLAVMKKEEEFSEVPWRKLGAQKICEHIWIADQKITVDPGVYVITVEGEDEWWKYKGTRLLHVK